MGYYESLKEQFNMLYSEADFEFLRFDNEKIVAKDAEINKVLSIELAGFNNITDDLAEFTTVQNFEASNKDLKVFKNRGFYIKKYSEFLIEVFPVYSEVLTEDIKLKVNGYTVRIGHPSNLFQLLFGYISRDKLVDGWYYFHTISVEDAPLDEVDRIIEAALFLLANHSEVSIHTYPKVIEFISYDDSVTSFLEPVEALRDKQEYLDKIHYLDALALYNTGKRNNDPISFYRVLEFFFLINHKNNILSLVDEYNNDKDENILVNGVRGIFTQNEVDFLSHLLETLDITDIISEANEMGITNDKEFKEFVNELYTFRNSLVHSKEESKFDITIPVSITNDTINNWTNLLEKLSIKAIVKFCFSNGR